MTVRAMGAEAVAVQLIRLCAFASRDRGPAHTLILDFGLQSGEQTILLVYVAPGHSHLYP